MATPKGKSQQQDNQKKKKTPAIHKTDTPFDTAVWPQISTADSELILELLCKLLSPLGHHRRTHPPPSKVSRARKRKRKQATDDEVRIDSEPRPERPAISRYVVVGLNSTARHLERLSALANANAESTAEPSKPPPLSLIFLPSAPSSNQQFPLQFQHLPTLAYLAALPADEGQMARTSLLIPLPLAAEKDLAKALGLPRASAVGVLADAPGADGLVELCRSKVEPIDLPWLKEVISGEGVKWRGTKISTEGGR